MNHLKTHQTNPTTAQYRPVQSNTNTAQYSQYPKPELFGQTRPEPDPKSKSPTRQTLVRVSYQIEMKVGISQNPQQTILLLSPYHP